MKTDRLKELSGISESLELVHRSWKLVPSPTELPERLKLTPAALQDPQIEIFNCTFRTAEGPYDKALFRKSVKKLLGIFDTLKAKGKITGETLYSEDDGQYGTRESFEKLISGTLPSVCSSKHCLDHG